MEKFSGLVLSPRLGALTLSYLMDVLEYLLVDETDTDWVIRIDIGSDIDRVNTLSKTEIYGEPPKTIQSFLVDGTDSQKRLVIYYKVFRFFFKKGQAGKRVKLPECVVQSIRDAFPHGRSDEDFDEIEISWSFFFLIVKFEL